MDNIQILKDLYQKVPPSKPKKLRTSQLNVNPNYDKSEFEPRQEVIELIAKWKQYFARGLANDTVASFKESWYKDNNLSDELINYLETIKINDLIWRLRYESIMTGDGFAFPFVVSKEDTKLHWITLGSNNIVLYQRLIDEYINITFYFTPLEGYSQSVAIVACKNNMLIYLNLKEDGGVNSANFGTDGGQSNFNFYHAIVSQKKFDYDNNLLLINWTENPLYTNAFDEVEWEIRTLAQAKFETLYDMMLSGNRTYRYETEGEQLDNYRQTTKISKRHWYLNNRQPTIMEKTNLATPASIGAFTPTSTASAFDVYLLIATSQLTDLNERLGMFHTLSTKGKAQQHSTEILTQNKNAISLGQKKIRELKEILVKWLNLIIRIKKFNHPIITFNNFTFEYQLPYQKVLETISSLDKTNNKPNKEVGNKITTSNEKT